jgi:hypothetical protein
VEVGVLLVVVGPDRPYHDQQHSYLHTPTVKPEAATAVVELLMMGGPVRPDHYQQHSYLLAPTIKPKAATAVVELLMMGVRKSETC